MRRIFYSSDFFTSRRVRKGDHYYDRNDIVQVVSGRGAVFPEFAFDYSEPPDADEWSAHRLYSKGDYVSLGGEVFRATWPSGDGASFEHRHFGAVAIGPVSPDPSRATTVYRFEYEDGRRDSISVWRRVRTTVWYRPKDAPITINGLRVEVRLAGNDGETKRLNAGAVIVERSNVTFNNPAVTVRDREATLSNLVSSRNCVNIEFNNGYFSGATSHHLGYNLLNSNVANVRYNHCISTNSRKGLDGRHAKNVTIQGGFYNVIDDHYGRNFIIRDVTLTGQTTFVPGDGTPDADLQRWGFRTIRPLGYSGANLYVENCVIDRANAILAARGDVGDLYGRIVLRNIHLRRNPGNVHVFTHCIAADFDYAHDVRVPDVVIVEDIVIENPGRLTLNIGRGFGGGDYGRVLVRGSGPFGNVYSSSASTTFLDCEFSDTQFEAPAGARFHFRNSVFSGNVTGIDGDRIGMVSGNFAAEGATISFPIAPVEPETSAAQEDRNRP